MRYGVLSDVHGNLHALEAALDALRREDVDEYLCAGDLVGYGAFPDECVERVLALPGTCVVGNHDLMALGELSSDHCIPLARVAMEWTRSFIREETRARLARLPRRAVIGDVVLAHGSLDDPQEYVTSAQRAAAELARARRLHPGATAVVLGHTHAAFAADDAGVRLAAGAGVRVEWPKGRGLLLNPGAVGQSRERNATARLAVLDSDSRHAVFHAVEYDLGASRAALVERGLDVDSYHLRPPAVWRRAAGWGMGRARAGARVVRRRK